MSARIIASLCLLAFAAGCSSSEDASSPADAGSDAAHDAPPEAAPPMPDAGPLVRSVELRNPFGDTTQQHNLLVDGDFELTAGQGQYGWQAVQNGAVADIPRETGGLCHSGVACAAITSDYLLLGFGVAAPEQSMQVSLWSKPPVPDCTLTVVALINCDSVIASTIATVPTESDVPDASGWCHHLATAPALALRPCFVVQSFADPDARTLIDHGGIYALEGTRSNTLLAGAPSAERFERVQKALRVLRERTPIGRAGPSRP
jgi:hypothetical protein